MSRQLALIVLCGMCMSVFSDDEGENCIFDFESFEAVGNSDDLILDFSGLGISTLTEGSNTYHYITGEFKTKSKVDKSLSVDFNILKFQEGSVVSTYRDACEFSADIYPQYLKPIAGTHNNVPNATLCERAPGSIHLYPAKNSEELQARSKLDEGKYRYEVSYYNMDGTNVGGMNGVFNVIRV